MAVAAECAGTVDAEAAARLEGVTVATLPPALPVGATNGVELPSPAAVVLVGSATGIESRLFSALDRASVPITSAVATTSAAPPSIIHRDRGRDHPPELLA